MVSSATFRAPGPLAITVATVDAMSDGRLEEQLTIVTGLWATPVGETFSFDGAHYALRDSPGLPKPVQQPLPVVIGGKGPR